MSPKDTVSTAGIPYVGSNGIIQQFINRTSWLNWNHMDTYNFTKQLAMTFETPYHIGDRHGSYFKGWFVAPATTNYRFYLACDDYCSLKLGNTSNQIANTTLVANNWAATDYRDFWETRGGHRTDQKRISDWISLTAGEHYYIEGQHLEGNGGDHFTTAVEIEQTEIVGHHHSMKEVQYLSVYPA